MEKVLKEMRKTMLCVTALGKDGNLQSCFSSLEIIWTLYDKIFHINDKVEENKNVFVLSKGQSNLALMTVLAQKGILKRTELDSFCQFSSRISMQADRTKFDSIITTSAGSLGHGFPMAVGIAWAKKIKNERGRVFCLAGDGEMNEGSMWEAALFASSENLDNLVLVIDDNSSIQRMINNFNLKRKLESFGFLVSEVDGHNIDDLEKGFLETPNRPYAVIAKTMRGWGSKTLMNDRSWFHRYPKDDELKKMCDEVQEF